MRLSIVYLEWLSPVPNWPLIDISVWNSNFYYLQLPPSCYVHVKSVGVFGFIKMFFTHYLSGQNMGKYLVQVTSANVGQKELSLSHLAESTNRVSSTSFNRSTVWCFS